MSQRTVYSDPSLKRRRTLNRYLDLPKFVDFLRTKELHLESASKFTDHMEGTLPELIRHDFSETPDIIKSLDNISILELERKNKNRTNLSCWTSGTKDNMALWKIYGGSKESVAISTTVERMIASAFNWLKFGRVKLIKVRYIDHAGRLPNGVYALDENVFALKHKAYFYEKEVRVVLTRPNNTAPYPIRLPVSINKLITKITVAPEAEEWFFKLVIDLTKKYSVSVPVKRSDLAFLIDKAKRHSTHAGQQPLAL